MKKILFLLLSTCSMYGQIVPTGQEQDFDYGIKNTASQLDDNAVFITVQNSDGVQGKSTSSVWAKKIYVDNADVKKSFLSTGLIKNGLVQANADPTKFNITAGIGIISNFDDPENPTSTIVNFPAFIGITPTYLTTSNITYIAINSSATIVQQATPFTNVQRRDYIILGAVIHSNLTTINLINNISAPTNAGTNQLHDLMEAIGALNVDGNKITANGANLSINKTAGDIFKLGVNFANDWKNPHKLNLPLQTLATFRYRTQNGTEGANVTVLNPALYDVANVLTAVPSNKFSIQTVTLFQTGAIRVQYGQATYATLSEAESAINTRTYNVEANIAANGITRAYIILKNTATSLQNASDTKIVEAGKFGNVGGSGGAITLDAIIAALGYTPENVANKDNGTVSTSTTTYPTSGAVKTYVDSKVPTTYAKVVYVNATSPNTATIFDLNNPPVTNDNALKIDTANLYIGSDASTWVYNGSTYVTKTITSATSNFYITGTTTDAGNNKTTSISRNAGVRVNNTSPDISFYAQNSSTGHNFVSNAITGGTGYNYIGQNNGVNTFTVDKLGVVTGSNGTLIGGALTAGYIPKATGANSLGNSLIYDNSTNVGIGTTSPNYSSAGRTVVDVNGTSQSMLALSVGGVGKGFLFYTGTDMLISNENNGSIKLNTNGSQKAEITAGGNVILGTTTDNGIDRVQVNGTISATGGTTANQVVVKSQLDAKVSLTGNETIAGNKTLSGTTTLNETIIREGYQLKFPKGVMYQSSVGTNALTDNRTVSFPDASGTVALVETVRPYKVYTALLSQSGTSAPTATVLENTLGTVVWTRSNTGQYVGTLTGAFTDQKTIIFVNRSNPAATAFDTNMAANVININTVGYTTFSNSAYVDGQTNSASIEIRVYN